MLCVVLWRMIENGIKGIKGMMDIIDEKRGGRFVMHNYQGWCGMMLLWDFERWML